MIKYFTFAGILFMLLQASGLKAHPLHLTITNIDVQGDSISLAVRLFMDDYSLGTAHPHSSAPNNDKTAGLDSQNIQDYITDHLNIWSASKKVSLEFIKTEKDERSICLFYRGKLEALAGDLIIENHLFTDQFADQKNMVIFCADKKETGLEFTPGDTKKTITLVP